MTLETKRLILRPWTEDDAGYLYEYARDPRVGPAAGWAPHTSVINSAEIIKTVLMRPETYAVVPKDCDHIVGSIGLMFEGEGHAPIKKKEAEIGYWIGVPYWGQGMIPEAVNELLRRCFDDLGLRGVWCGYYDGNLKSKRVSDKCGLAYHHTVFDALTQMGDICTEHFTYMSKKDYRYSK